MEKELIYRHKEEIEETDTFYNQQKIKHERE